MDRTLKKKCKALKKYNLNSAAYNEGVIGGVMDNLLTKFAKITKKKDKSKMKLIRVIVQKNFNINKQKVHRL